LSEGYKATGKQSTIIYRFWKTDCSRHCQDRVVLNLPQFHSIITVPDLLSGTAFQRNERTSGTDTGNPSHQSNSILLISTRDSQCHISRRCVSNPLEATEPLWSVPELGPIPSYIVQPIKRSYCLAPDSSAASTVSHPTSPSSAAHATCTLIASTSPT
jgi:hypothetical protein